MIGEVLCILMIEAQEKGISLTMEDSPLCPQAFLGDAGRIKQVVTNICGQRH